MARADTARRAACLAAAVGLLGSTYLAGPALSAPDHAGATACPPAKDLLTASTRWRNQALRRGVTLSRAVLGTGKRIVDLDVLRVDLAAPGVGIAPVAQTLSARKPLSRLAAGRSIVAAINGGFFDTFYGGMTGPFVAPGPIVLSRHHSMVAGIGTDGRAENGHVWLVGEADSTAGNHRLAAVNYIAPPAGLSVYTPVWGTGPVPVAVGAVTRAVDANGAVGASGGDVVPPGGYLFLASSAKAIEWLTGLLPGATVSISTQVQTDAPVPFVQGYGTGTEAVQTTGQVRTGLYCRPGAINVPRTQIAWRPNGRHLILATVTSPPGSRLGGVDEDQMSEIMVGLKVARAFALDGGGSTEMLARRARQSRFTFTTRRPHEGQRPIPLGIGVQIEAGQ
jgi:Phosphodiester glycosidase